MRLANDDRKAAAIIRDAAMELFAERGFAGVTVRQVASAAGVSPGLVMHHFGSKDGLKAAVDGRAVEFVDAMLGELVRIEEEGGSASLAALFVDRLERQPALAGYLRRLLADGGEPADELFERLFETTLVGMRSLTAAGFARPAQDEPVRVAFLLANDLALVLFRRQIERVIRVDPLTKAGLVRWTSEVVDAYTNGVFVSSTAVADRASSAEQRGPGR